MTKEEVEKLFGYECIIYTNTSYTHSGDIPIYFTNGYDGKQPLLVGFKSGWLVELDNITLLKLK